ncbi:MAG: hypothetical protein ACAI43_10550 [Phycisphaerae bacterium]|nr:hypothetical protein [Tepidisphaeraceae bacterium]
MRVAPFLLLLALVASASRAAEPVSVTKAAPKIERKTFDPADPKSPKPPLKENEIALCEYVFRIEVDFRFAPVSVTPTAGGFRASVRIDSVAIRLSMPVTIWLPKGVDDHVRAHEEGHLKIAETFYKDAQTAARDAAKGVVGAPVEGEGKDKNAAVQAALQKAATGISDRYVAAVKGPTDEVEQIFDRITDHSRVRDVMSDAGVKAATEEWKRGKK